MKLENTSETVVLQDGASCDQINMSLDMESANILMNILSKNLYSDPIGSTVRETTSNGLDSHRKAGVTEAIIVSLKVNQQSNYEFSVEDFGVGLDHNDVEKIISKYGKSTKRQSNEELGMFGLGFKSPLAYSSSFYFVCRKNGIERKYMLAEGEDVNTIDLLYETSTDKRNGVKVIVPVKFQDRYIFKEKINNQLAYFENVYFDVNVQNNVITNNFQIYRSENFQFSEINTDTYLHLCLDNVYYPLDFQKLGISAINIPVGLRFNLSDGIFPTPNRETIIYTSKTKQLILDKLILVADYFVEKYNETSIDCQSIFEIFDYYNGGQRNITLGNKVLDASKLQQHSNKTFIKPVYKKYSQTDFHLLYKNKDSLFYEYKVNMEFVRGQFRQQKYYNNYHLSYNDIVSGKKIFLYDELFVGNKKSYIKSLLPQNDYQSIKFVKKTDRFTLRNHSKRTTMDNYVNLLELRKYPKNIWREKIKEFQSVLAELTEKIEFVDDIKIPQIWLDARKKKKILASPTGVRKVKLQGELNVKVAEDLQRYVNNKNSKLSPAVIKVENIESLKTLIVYGKQADEKLIDNLYSVSGRQKIKYFVLSEREHKLTESFDFHNFISINKFMEGKNKPFKRIVTSYLISKLKENYSATFNKKIILKKVSNELYERLVLLDDYRNKNYFSSGSENIFSAMLVIAEEYKLFDETIYTEYCQLKQLLDNFPFIENTIELLHIQTGEQGKEKYLNILIDLFKYHRLKIDYINYKLPSNPEIIEEVTEEITN